MVAVPHKPTIKGHRLTAISWICEARHYLDPCLCLETVEISLGFETRVFASWQVAIEEQCSGAAAPGQMKP